MASPSSRRPILLPRLFPQRDKSNAPNSEEEKDEPVSISSPSTKTKTKWKFEEIWNHTKTANGPTPPQDPAPPLATQEEGQVVSSDIVPDNYQISAVYPLLTASTNEGLAPISDDYDDEKPKDEESASAAANHNKDPVVVVVTGTTRIEGPGHDDNCITQNLCGIGTAAASGDYKGDEGSAAATSAHNNTSNAAVLSPLPTPRADSRNLSPPPSTSAVAAMDRLKRWGATLAPYSSSKNSAGTVGAVVVTKPHANSGDFLEATQVGGSFDDVGNALDDDRSSRQEGDDDMNNPKIAVLPTQTLSDEEEQQDDYYNGNLNKSTDSNDELGGIEMSLRQYRWARMLSRHRSVARLASWRNSLQDLKRRRRRCFWSTLILVVLVLLIIIIVSARCGGGRCSSSRSPNAESASTGGETVDPKFGRLTRSPTPAPSPGATATDDDAIINEQDPFQSLFGGTNPNIIVLSPTMSTSEIQSTVDSIFYQQQNNEMGTERYTIYFLPGSYGSTEQPLYLQIGYYTELSGLGAMPSDVMVYGKIEVYNRCFQPDPYKQGMFVPGDGSGLCFALNSFWRSLSNLSIQIVSLNQDSCRATAMFWAVSQAVSMRRVDIRGGDVSLMDYCTQPAFASGGFIADSRAGNVISGSQQQFVARNMDITQWQGSVWNQVFLGVAGAPIDSSFPDPAITVFSTTPVKREKPYLYVDGTGTTAYVHVPALESSTVGTTWAAGSPTPGTPLPLSDFFVADPSHSASSINKALAAGKNVILSPGVYDIDTPIIVDRENAVVLGTGHATLTAVNGVTPLQVRNHPGIIIAGVTLDAGETLSESLLEVGSADEDPTGDITNPITLSDVYFRLGGPHVGKAKTCLTINANDVLIDHTWVWRADHGVENFNPSDGFMGDNERWTVNVGEIGVLVNGDDVIANGLFVEHYQQYNVLWKGERGRVYFFQNELPYDPPTQADWTASDGTLGWAAYKVDDAVTDHQLWAGGVYCYNRNNPDIVTANAFEVPQSTGIQLQRVFTRNLSGPGSILAIVNGVGDSATNQTMGPHYTDYGSAS